jgi:hypothetical protein
MLDSGAATAAPSVITRVRIGHGLAPRTAPIAGAITGVGICRARAAPSSTAIARAITRVGISQASATRATTPASWTIARIRICGDGNGWGFLKRFGGGAARCAQKGRGRRQIQDQ